MISTKINFLQKLQDKAVRQRIKPYEAIEGFLSLSEAMALYRYASMLPNQSTIVEIGCWKGKSTFCLAQGLKRGQVVVIDPFDAFGEEGSAEIYESQKGNQPLLNQFKSNMRELGVLDKIKILSGMSQDFVGQIPSINLLFIDGDHSIEGCKADFLNYAPYIASGGYIAFHDFYELRDELGPTWVIKNLVLPKHEFEFVGLFDSLWVGKKR
ncbi:hypothetical protein NIES2135_09170 [Leptolyngbya boryana NIES-2135]|jgi:predicted O-methyltransferase YrrM|uniref:Class I SAM-dependent methyltransferase n=1 Tax=Leptolyngbya boryana NIES-2135 TaxID=1973484 RepID=A0A1Z4JBM3_LEPBY|nr:MULTISPECIES: class I SAM-dependent methyltransferase [Leptolyngbya]BAY54103.1 hypothetical protein NIES2135_09170 [Leptolyngbya boryana NIES-2135]MBD2369759.1 class I SAM-dependent methyltransferase [Leptolyngbya sp. FACHB-161]MBD2376040.1 class I SAM-dependent methyltransferase [Leptolyngbya sp. FACHB-238]MBD2400316.1 class I SAM-dependent methyltransferase [Leptolyngbya sp. FACHB-239]MBD2406857.1 class I SAM-dependent methyltransferase [Leptolyngbya sp. FACHB-402]